MRVKPAGFTLIEVLIGMSILSIMMLLLFATLRTCVQSWNLGEKKIAEVSQAGIIQNFFQSKLHSTLPLKANFLKEEKDIDEEDRQRFSFEGSENQLQFVSAMPASAGRLGLQLFTMSLQQAEKGEGSDLLVDIKPFFPKNEDEEWQNEEVVILKNVRNLQFAYFGVDEETQDKDKEEAFSWQGEWLERQTLPKLVSIDIELSNGQIWPQIVVALKVNTSGSNSGGQLGNPFRTQQGNPFGSR